MIQPAVRPRLHIAHVITDLGLGGAEMVLLRLLEKSDRARFDSNVISLRGLEPLGHRIADAGFEVTALGIRAFPGPLDLLRLTRLLRRRRVDVVQTWMLHADLVGGLAAQLAGRIPVAWGIHAGKLDRRIHTRRATWTVAVNARLSGWLPSKIVCCSETSVAEFGRLGFPRERMLVIENGFDLERFRPSDEARRSLRRELSLADDALLVGLVARFHPQKDHRSFALAAQRVLGTHPDAHFVLCGGDVVPENRALVEWLGPAAPRTQLLGARDDVPRIMAALDVACSSASYGEAFPLVIGEAMASGVPCAVTDCGDSARLVGDTGRVAPTQDPEALARAICGLLALPATERRALGQAARRRIADHFTLEQMVRRYQALYEELAT